MRVRILQVAYGDDESVAARIDRVAALVAAQTDADLVVLPELWSPTGMDYRQWPGHAEPLDGPTFSAMAEAARAAGVYLHAGSIIEAAGPGDDRGPQGRGRWNTSALFSRSGELLASYRKIHRFGFAQGEPQLIEAGTELVTADIEVDGAVVRLGLATCYDLRFPEQFRQLLDAGATVLVVPAAWPLARVEHWTLLGRARAIEDQCALIACNTGGTHAGIAMGGHSQIVSAAGTVLAEAGTGEEILTADLDLTATAAWRERFPVLADRRL